MKRFLSSQTGQKNKVQLNLHLHYLFFILSLDRNIKSNLNNKHVSFKSRFPMTKNLFWYMIFAYIYFSFPKIITFRHGAVGPFFFWTFFIPRLSRNRQHLEVGLCFHQIKWCIRSNTSFTNTTFYYLYLVLLLEVRGGG